MIEVVSKAVNNPPIAPENTEDLSDFDADIFLMNNLFEATNDNINTKKNINEKVKNGFQNPPIAFREKGMIQHNINKKEKTKPILNKSLFSLK